MSSPGDGGVHFDVGGDAVGVVTLDRAHKLNALTPAMFAQLKAAAARAARSVAAGDCRSVLVTGAGRAFSAGMDLAELRAQAAGRLPTDAELAALQDAFNAVEDLAVPTVAALPGPALGAGCQLALACHLRIGSPDARLGLPEARLGLVPDLGASWRLPRIVGLGRATDLAVTGRVLDAGTALAWGLLDAVVDGAFDTGARAYAARLAAGATVATGAVAGLLRAGLASSDRRAALAGERAAQARCLRSSDFREAAAATADRREPTFEGR